MADNPGQGVSSLPLPPMQYVNAYSDENIKRGRNPRPPPPPQDSYSMFGVAYHSDDTIIQPLENLGFRRLYPQAYDHKRELKKLNHSILVNFLDLLDILIKCPDSPKRAEKIQDLNLLFINTHHLINEFRPHQARETLRVMMEVQKRQRIDTVDRFQKHLDKVIEVLQGCATALPDTDIDNKLAVTTQLMDTEEPDSETALQIHEVDEIDKMMCHIVDDIS
ncbi:mediator of RNA polymerase II transcription subunit 7-like [Tubulanus polymorphus]|uniref:mediator of RNA polymerase II transcription subunit 7-like n=1 Tax=Tubulanus polymorphus TaxID=672921 RepID=UPI003DA2FB87